jgi:DNA mismatch repair protein MutL
MMTAIRMALTTRAAGEEPVPEPASVPDLQPPVIPARPAEVPRAPSFHYPELSLEASGQSVTPGQRQEPQDAGKTLRSPWGSCSILGWLGRKYAILETEDGMVLLDPPAAHERVLFERYMRQIMEGTVQRQGLLAPETIELSPVEAAAVTKNLDVLNDMGFELSSFGSQAFLVEALPACLGDISAKSLIRELAQAVEQGGRRRMKWTDEAIAQTVCHTAVQRRDRLSEQELKRLVDDLAVTNMPYTCPHGRPTMIFMSIKELDRKFGRA